MNNQIRLTESDLYRFVSKVLKIENNKQNKTFGESLEELLEFHIKIHKGYYAMEGNHYELERHKDDYIKALFPNNNRVIKEYNKKFTNPLIVESLDVDYVDNFFGFIRRNFIKENREIIKEYQPGASDTLTRNNYSTNVNKQLPTNNKMELAKRAVQPIFKLLAKAFDGAGTNEALAVQAILKLKNKEEVYQLDKLVRLSKKMSLKNYINGDMSDFDSTEYRKIWTHLGKFGMTGANYNEFLKSVGKGDLAGAVGAGWKFLKEKGLTWFFNGLRNALNSAAGTAVQLFLDSFGVGAIANAVIWGIMTVWDLINISAGGWGNFFLSALGLLTVGAMAPVLAPLAKVIKPIKGGLQGILIWLMKSKFGKTIAQWLPKILSGASKFAGLIQQGINWLISKFGKVIGQSAASKLSGAVGKCIEWVKSLISWLSKYSGREASDTVITSRVAQITNSKAATAVRNKLSELGFNGVESLLTHPKWSSALSKLDKPSAKLVDEYIHNNIRKYGWEGTKAGICKYMGKIACEAADLVGNAFKLKNAATKLKDKSFSAARGKGKIKILSKQEMANLSPEDLAAYKSNLAKIHQDTLKNLHKSGKAANKIITAAGNEAGALGNIGSEVGQGINDFNQGIINNAGNYLFNDQGQPNISTGLQNFGKEDYEKLMGKK